MTAGARPPLLPEARRRKRRRFLIGLVIGLTIIAAPLVWFLGWRISNRAAVTRLEAAARQRGEPLTLADLATNYPPVPDRENAAVALMNLWEKSDPVCWRAYRQNKRPLPDLLKHEFPPDLPYLGALQRKLARAKPLDPDTLADAEAWLAANSAHLQAVRQALQLPRCRFPLIIEEGRNAPMLHLRELEVEADYFRLEAALATERGDLERGLAALACVPRLGRLVEQEPLVRSQFACLALFNMTLNDSERFLSRRALSGAQLDQLEKLIESLQMPGALRRGYLEERALHLAAYDLPHLIWEGTNTPPGVFPFNPEEDAAQHREDARQWRAWGVQTADKRLALECYDRAIQLAAEGTPRAIQATERLFREADQRAQRFPPLMVDWFMLARQEHVACRFASLEGRRRSALTALAIERYRLTHQGLRPQTLDLLTPSLLPKVPSDPFDGQPLRYRRLLRGYVVYSVGDDLKDNGGLEAPTRFSKGAYDRTFTVER
jgi:hypothetical protein